MNIIVCPGGRELTKDAQDIFGDSRVVAGVFRDPLHINELSEDEVTFAKEYFEGQGKKVQIEA